MYQQNSQGFNTYPQVQDQNNGYQQPDSQGNYQQSSYSPQVEMQIAGYQMVDQGIGTRRDNRMVVPVDLPYSGEFVQIIAIRTRLDTPSNSREPVEITCSSCHNQGITNVKYQVGCGTWFNCCILVCAGCIPCSFIPFCMKDCKDVHHTCSSCGTPAGTFKFRSR